MKRVISLLVLRYDRNSGFQNFTDRVVRKLNSITQAVATLIGAGPREVTVDWLMRSCWSTPASYFFGSALTNVLSTKMRPRIRVCAPDRRVNSSGRTSKFPRSSLRQHEQGVLRWRLRRCLARSLAKAKEIFSSLRRNGMTARWSAFVKARPARNCRSLLRNRLGRPWRKRWQ